MLSYKQKSSESELKTIVDIIKSIDYHVTTKKCCDEIEPSLKLLNNNMITISNDIKISTSTITTEITNGKTINDVVNSINTLNSTIISLFGNPETGEAGLLTTLNGVPLTVGSLKLIT